MKKLTLCTAWAAVAAIALAFCTGRAAGAEKKAWRFDCGTADSPVMKGYERLTAEQAYSRAKGYGWESPNPKGVWLDKVFEFNWKTAGYYESYMKESLDALNRDAVQSDGDLAFRADVPNGVYRVTVVIGDMTQNLGSIDMTVNGRLVGEHLAAWTPGGHPGGGGRHRRMLETPSGWWNPARATVRVTDGTVRIRLTKNENFYDEQCKIQSQTEPEFEKTAYPPPYKRVGVYKAPYYYCGWPFVRNSVMAIEIVPDKPAPVVGENDQLKLTRAVKSPALNQAIEQFNAGKFNEAVKTLEGVKEPDAQAAKAIVLLWLNGRLEVDLVDKEDTLVATALEILRPYVQSHPEEDQVAEMLQDAETFAKAWEIHVTRGEMSKNENHFAENGKAIGLWWMIHEGTPLYYKAQLLIARAEHMLAPYMPARGTYREILKNLEKKFPDNRFVKYHLHETWDNHGDGSHFYDWFMKDYSQKVKDSPEWVRELYPAFQSTMDWSEWWIKFRQFPEGSIGGGWGDDVEVVGVFGYMGYTSRGIADKLVQGTARLINGMWTMSEVDQELGFCLPMSDAEHSSEWTGNTLGIMILLDYGNPTWIERSMKTAKLMRDLWTARNDKGQRHFRSNYFGAAQVGSGEQANDSFINYRAIRPASAVLWYNQNPAAEKVIVELADGWVDAAMSTDRDKPKGVLPTEISFPEGLLGGVGSPNWYTASHSEGTANADWISQSYKPYLQDLLMTAYQATRNPKYLKPLQIEFDLAKKAGNTMQTTSGARLQVVPEVAVYGKRNPDESRPKTPASAPGAAGAAPAKPGSKEWVGQNLKHLKGCVEAERLLAGRKGKLENDLTKADILHSSRWVNSELKWRWPLHTTDAGPTDRIGFGGCFNSFLIYTGGRMGGPLFEAAVTYENTTREFAAAVLGTDPQGFRLLYHSLTPDTREIGILPWHLEPGARYSLRYGPDANEDETMDSVTEEREFVLPQIGTPIQITVKPRVTYVVEVDQISHGKGAVAAPDPGLSSDDIRYSETSGLILARIHNVGSKPVENVEVAAYDGDPKNDGTLISKSLIPNIEAPNDLEPRTTTIGFTWTPTKAAHEIYVVIDPENRMKDEITNFNNTAHKTITGAPKSGEAKQPVAPAGRGGGQ